MTRAKFRPAPLAEALKNKFGDEWKTWTPETLYHEITDELGDMSSSDWELVQALRAYLTTDFFWTSAGAFENIVLAVNGVDVNPASVQIALPEEMAYALKALKGLREQPTEWARDVRGYVRMAMDTEGFVVYPEDLKDFEDKDLADQVAGRVRPMLVESRGETSDADLDALSIAQNKLFAVQEYIKALEVGK